GRQAALELEEGAGEAAHIADEDNLTLLPGDGEDRLELRHAEADGFFDENMFARLDRPGEKLGMEMIRRQDEDGVERWVREDGVGICGARWDIVALRDVVDEAG